MPFALAAVAFFIKNYRNTNIVKIFNITKKNKYIINLDNLFFIIIFAGKIDMIYMLSVNNNVK